MDHHRDFRHGDRYPFLKDLYLGQGQEFTVKAHHPDIRAVVMPRPDNRLTRKRKKFLLDGFHKIIKGRPRQVGPANSPDKERITRKDVAVTK